MPEVKPPFRLVPVAIDRAFVRAWFRRSVGPLVEHEFPGRPWHLRLNSPFLACPPRGVIVRILVDDEIVLDFEITSRPPRRFEATALDAIREFLAAAGKQRLAVALGERSIGDEVVDLYDIIKDQRDTREN